MDGITLRDGESRVVVTTLGAELQSWTVAGHDLLWRQDARWWPQTSPVLFPVCGWLQDGLIRVDGQTYACGLHGFAARSRFAVVHAEDAEATFELRDDDATRAVFPFGFRLRVTYRLQGGALMARFSVENTGTRRLPYGLGLHPGFAWPFAGGARDDYRIVFEHEEAPSVPVLVRGLVTEARRLLPFEGRTLPLSDALFASGGMVLRDAASRSVTFAAPRGAAIKVRFEDLPHIVLWSRSGAPFVCVEGWCGYNDSLGFTGDIHDKPGMRFLDIGAAASHAVSFSFHGNAADASD